MKFYVESYGCTMNQGETEMLADEYISKGHQRVKTLEEADMVIIGTCVVITKTEARMRRRIKHLSSKCSNVIVTGCLTTTDRGIQNWCPGASTITPSEIPITQDTGQKGPIGTIPISTGCLGMCSYCITKLARGELKSRTPKQIMERFKSLISNGTREIRLSCQDTASYGADIQENLPDLLRQLCEIPGDHRIRIGMMNPDTAIPILYELIEVMRNEKIYNFVHLPLQSGSDKILWKMNRNYTVEDWIGVVEKLRKTFPSITISTDVIVGFPGETDDDFKMTEKVLKTVRPDIVNITRFSTRPGTPAADMKNRVHSRIKKERSKILTDLHMEISRSINETYVGNISKVLILEDGKEDTMIGRTDDYKVVVLKEKLTIGRWFDVKISGASEVYLLGKMI